MAAHHRRLVLLSLIAIGLILSGWSLNHRLTLEMQPAKQAKLIPKLVKKLADLTEVSVHNGTRSVTLQRHGDAPWVVAELADYPVDMPRLRGFMNDLSQSRLLEEKTSKPENYALLGADDASATQVILKAGEGVVADLLLGKPAERRAATYVRLPKRPAVWKTSQVLKPPADPMEWVKRDILMMDEARLREVTVTGAAQAKGNASRRISRDTVADPYTVTPRLAPDDKALEYQLLTLPRLFTRLSLVAVMPESALRQSSGDMTEIQTFDGLHVQLRFNGEGEATERWVVVTAFADEKAPDAVKAEAEAINARTKGWAYRFAPYVMTQLRLVR